MKLVGGLSSLIFAVVFPGPPLCAQPARPLETVRIADVLPMNVMIDPTYPPREKSYLAITATEVKLQRLSGDELKTVASIPLDVKAMESAIAGTDKDCFRGWVEYSEVGARHATAIRISTPLGNIREYGVFIGEPDPGRWPQSILRLRSLIELCKAWSQQLGEIKPE